MTEIIQESNMSDTRLAELIDQGFTLLQCVPKATTYYNNSVLETEVLYILSKTSLNPVEHALQGKKQCIPPNNGKIKNYEVSFVVDARFNISVEAESPQQAHEIARQAYSLCSNEEFMANTEIINSRLEHVEDENGNFFYDV